MTNPLVPVTVHGFTWTAGLVGLLNLLVGGVLVAVVKQWPVLKKIQIEKAQQEDTAAVVLLAQQQAVIDRQDKRIDEIERAATQERMDCNAKIERMQVAYDADKALNRHKLNNLDQCLTMILTLIEESPEKAQSAAKRVREMRARQEELEANEKSAIHTAKIAATAPAPPTS